ncbi:unnamed protein product [Cylindrotheca closterium]|uniref:Calmodulin n=1 Tax=Cylindrotheca closterium TaxID=2856 RepID=A0AAD2FL10_9STRA|nr:unnamed protein product [Cylindrotheca closterium]
MIGNFAFYSCIALVEAILTATSILEIPWWGFFECDSLQTIKPSVAAVLLQTLCFRKVPEPNEPNSFKKNTLLQDCFGEAAESTVAGLVHRFDSSPVHKICYDHSATTAQELRQCIEDQDETESLMYDDFGMTPFHVLFSTPEPSEELLQVLLDKFPYYDLGWEDANDNVAMDYLVANWTRENKVLLQMALQSWMIDRLEPPREFIS